MVNDHNNINKEQIRRLEERSEPFNIIYEVQKERKRIKKRTDFEFDGRIMSGFTVTHNFNIISFRKKIKLIMLHNRHHPKRHLHAYICRSGFFLSDK